jgi:hypothetical protein
VRAQLQALALQAACMDLLCFWLCARASRCGGCPEWREASLVRRAGDYPWLCDLGREVQIHRIGYARASSDNCSRLGGCFVGRHWRKLGGATGLNFSMCTVSLGCRWGAYAAVSALDCCFSVQERMLVTSCPCGPVPCPFDGPTIYYTCAKRM